MKLFARYNRVNVAATIGVFIFGSFLFFFLIRYILLHQVDEALQAEKTEISNFVYKHGRLPDISNTSDEHTEYQEVTAPIEQRSDDKNVRFEKASEWSRQITFPLSVNGKDYAVMVSKPLEETEDLLRVIIVVTTLLIAIILIVNFFISRAILGKLWSPFYTALGFLKEFKIEEKAQFKLERSSIDEFEQLNNAIKETFQRAQTEFDSLNEFTSYAAHEMQTPLAVIRSQLELIQQDEAIFARQARHIANIEKSVRKLSRLHQSLMLLHKIENGRFRFEEQVRIDIVLQNKLEELDMLIDAKNIALRTDIQPVGIIFHAYLAEILLGNIINNAIRYNYDHGDIAVLLDSKELVVSNTSYLPELKQEQVFQRFFRASEAREEGNGLGLAIVKRICDAAGLPISYTYVKGLHSFRIAF